MLERDAFDDLFLALEKKKQDLIVFINIKIVDFHKTSLRTLQNIQIFVADFVRGTFNSDISFDNIKTSKLNTVERFYSEQTFPKVYRKTQTRKFLIFLFCLSLHQAWL